MDHNIIVAIVTGVATIIAVVINSKATNKEITHKIETQQAVTETKLDGLSSQITGVNAMVGKVPVIEERIRTMDKRIEVLERENQRPHS